MSKALGLLAFFLLLIVGIVWAYFYWKTDWNHFDTMSSQTTTRSSSTNTGGSSGTGDSDNAAVSKLLLESSALETQAREYYQNGNRKEALDIIGLSIGAIEKISQNSPKYLPNQIAFRLNSLKELQAKWRNRNAQTQPVEVIREQEDKPETVANLVTTGGGDNGNNNQANGKSSAEATTTPSILDDSKRSISAMAGISPPPPIPTPADDDSTVRDVVTLDSNDLDIEIIVKDPAIMWYHAASLRWAGEKFESEGDYTQAVRSYQVSNAWYEKITEHYPDFQAQYTSDGIDFLQSRLDRLTR